ncbi:MAG: MFS transporter [Nocardioides sp.]
MARTGSLFSSLRHRDYRLLLGAFTLSDIGNWAYNLALAVWIYEATGSVGWVAASTVCRFVPALLLSPYAGVVADRFEKVRLMVSLDLALAGLMSVMAVLMMVDAHPVTVVAVATFSSVVATAYAPAAAAMTPVVVSEDDLASANSLRNTVDNVTVVAGPGLGAVFLAFGSPAFATWIDAGTFLLSALVVSRIHTRSGTADVTEGGTAGVLAQMTTGMRAIFADRDVAVLVGCSVAVTFGFGIDTVLLVVASDEILGTGADGYGYLLAGLGIGGILAAGLVPRLEARARLAPVILLGMVGYFLPTLVFVFTEEPAVAFVAMVLRGASTLVVDVLAITALQRALPHDILARVFGAFDSLCLGVVVLGSLLTPILIAITGLDTTVWVVAAGLTGFSLLGWPVLRAMDERSAARRAALAHVVALLEASDLFEHTGDGALHELASATTRVAVPSGEPVVIQGDVADAVYVVVSGTLSVSALDETRSRVDLPVLGPGDYFGEIGLIQRVRRTATVTPLEPVELLRVDGQAFLDTLTRSGPSSTILDGAALRLGRTHPSLRLRREGPTTTHDPTEGAPRAEPTAQ